MPPKPDQPRSLEDRFVDNVSRYPTYFVTTLLGAVWVLVSPFVNLWKRSPLAGASVTAGILFILVFIHFTLRGMAGEPFFPEWILSSI